jgi:hypothetical protein
MHVGGSTASVGDRPRNLQPRKIMQRRSFESDFSTCCPSRSMIVCASSRRKNCTPSRVLRFKTANPEHFGDDKWLRKQFRPPVGKLPPFAGVANHWLKDPAHWQWIGWRDWDCGYGANTIHYQEFENGLLVRIFNISPKVEHGEVFFLLNTDKYYFRDTNLKPAECIYRH